MTRRHAQILATVALLVSVIVFAVTMGFEFASLYVTTLLSGYVYAGIMGARRCE